MPFIVVVHWVDPSKHIDLYPEVLHGFKPKKRFKAPQREFFSVDTSNEAVELKTRIKTHVPVHRYRVVNDDDKTMGVTHEPRVDIIDDSGGLFGE